MIQNSNYMKIILLIFILFLFNQCITTEFIPESDFNENEEYHYTKKKPSEIDIFYKRPPYAVDYTGTVHIRNYNGKENMEITKKHIQNELFNLKMDGGWIVSSMKMDVAPMVVMTKNANDALIGYTEILNEMDKFTIYSYRLKKKKTYEKKYKP